MDHEIIEMDRRTDGAETIITWTCTCRCWVTVETVPAPDHHTPIEDRKANHLRQMAEVADGTALLGLPPHDYRLFLRRTTDGGKGQVAIWACWSGGYREILHWPWNERGLVQAQEWCDEHPTIWYHDHAPVGRHTLLAHA